MSETLKSAPYDLPAGSKVIYTADGGYDGQRELADKVLQRGEEYTLAGSSIGSTKTFFYLIESGGSFNSCLFSVRDEGEKSCSRDVCPFEDWFGKNEEVVSLQRQLEELQAKTVSQHCEIEAQIQCREDAETKLELARTVMGAVKKRLKKYLPTCGECGSIDAKDLREDINDILFAYDKGKELPVMTEQEIFGHNIKCKTVATPCPDCTEKDKRIEELKAEVRDCSDCPDKDTAFCRVGCAVRCKMCPKLKATEAVVEAARESCSDLYKHGIEKLKAALAKYDKENK